MKVCVVGGRGSIGTRYVSIIGYLGHEAVPFDLPEAHMSGIPKVDKYVIAVPTDLHYGYIRRLIEGGKTILCEKPLSKNRQECIGIAWYDNGYTVCNYKYVYERAEGGAIEYDYYNTGKDGLRWDCCQLLYLDPSVILRAKSPIWSLRIGGSEIPYRWVEESYIQMIDDFINGRFEKLWTFQDGMKMTEVVLE